MYHTEVLKMNDNTEKKINLELSLNEFNQIQRLLELSQENEKVEEEKKNE